MIVNFFKKYYAEIVLCLLLIGVAAVSLPNLTTKPRLWYDEGVNIEFAKNFLDFGKLDIQVSPGIFSQLTDHPQAYGYPLSIFLSLFFGIFGFGPVQARIYMLIWMLLALLSVFIFVKKLVGRDLALIVAALIATFASFHDNGRVVMGEIPGFVFLLWALYWFFWKNSYLISGLLFGLAISAKPSVYMSVFPAILVLLILNRKNFWKNSLKILAGILPAFFLRIWFAMPDMLSLVAWKEVINLFRNPFGNDISLTASFLNNLLSIPKTYTILYFGLFFAIILFEYFRYKKKDFIYNQFFGFTITYCFFAFLYYLKSPGWLRYLIAAEFLTFILLVPALKNIFKGRHGKDIFYAVAVSLIGFQIFYLFNYAKIFYSDSEERVINLIDTEFRDKTIGIFDIPEIGVFVDSSRKFQIYRMMGVPSIGKNPILYEPAPEIFIIRANNNEGIDKMLPEEKNIFFKKYYFLRTVGRYNIYSEIIF